jgi:hypothetical protein
MRLNSRTPGADGSPTRGDARERIKAPSTPTIMWSAQRARLKENEGASGVLGVPDTVGCFSVAEALGPG